MGKNNGKKIIKYETKEITQGHMIEIQAEAYYRG